MAGHSKWANIRFRKMGQDAKRGKLFTKYIREITIAARTSGAEASNNPRLRAAIDKALAANMTRDTIDRAIKRGIGGMGDEIVDEVRYEGYGPAGVAIIVDCVTNNRKRTVSEVRHAFTKYGGQLGTDGSVAYLFNRMGQIIFPPNTDENLVMEIALQTGAEDVRTDIDGSIEVQTSFEQFLSVKQAMEKVELKPERAEVTELAKIIVTITDKEVAEKCNKLIDMLEDLDDVQAVYTNIDFSEEVLEQMDLQHE